MRRSWRRAKWAAVRSSASPEPRYFRSRAVPVHPAVLIAHHHAAVELYDPPPHRVDDPDVMGGHDHGGAGLVDAVQQAHDHDGRVGIEVAGWLVRQEDDGRGEEGTYQGG